MVGRTPSAVEKMRAKIKKGWTRERVEWTAEEDDLIRTNRYKTNSELNRLLPGRSENAIQIRRRHIGVTGCRVDVNPFVIASRTVVAKTCLECGELMPGEKYSKGRNGTAVSYCRYCYIKRMRVLQEKHPERYSKRPGAQTKATAKFKRKMQQLTAPTATRNGYPYLESDYEILADPSLTILGKALRIQRSWVATASACGTRGFKSRGPVAAKSADHSWSIDNPNADRIDEITASLKQEFATAGVPFPAWDWDEEDLKEAAA